MRGGDLASGGLIQGQSPLKQVDVANEIRHKTAVGKFIDFFGSSDLQHLAVAHDRDARGHGHSLLLVMRHHYAGHAHRFDDVHQLKLGLLAEFFVQRAQWFIQQKQLRLFGQTAGQCHALLLPARQLVRFALCQLFQLNQLQHFIHARINLRTRHAFALKPKRNVFPDAEVRKQRVRLEHHVDGPLVRRKQGDVHPVQDDRAGSRLFKTRQHAQQRGLAATGTAQQGKYFALADSQ